MSRRSFAYPAGLGILALAVALLTVPACRSSDNSGDGDMMNSGGETQTFELHYDGDQDSSPNLAGNKTWEAAARFTSAQTAALAGGKLTEVRFYILTVPDSCKVKIYGVGTPTTPGAVLYSADVTASVAAASWNSHVLASPVTVPNGDLWISIEFSDAQTQPTIGCDPGPAVANGRWLWDSSLGTWADFFVDVNWNVRGIVEVTL